MASTEDLAKLSWEVYEGTTPYGWNRLTDSRDFQDVLGSVPGFYAAVYQNIGTGEIVIAYEGTYPIWSPTDWAANFALFLEGESPQFVAALEFAKAIRDQYAGTAPAITVTGHSLGGGLAQLAADVFGWRGVTFDAPGMHQLTEGAPAAQFDAFFARTGESFGHVSAGFSNLTVAGSVVSAVGIHIGARPDPIEVENGTLNVIELMAA